MNCNVIKDLIPLYIDGCCSEESNKIVKEHLESCDSCKQLFNDMNTTSDNISVTEPPIAFNKVNEWKASVFQSVLLFVSFGLITFGVALESKTPSGFNNSFWALNLVVPVTGFMLSLANWYFIRVYKSRKSFSICSFFITLGITICAYIWSGFHYEINLIELFFGDKSVGFIDITECILFLNGIGILLTVVLCALSKILSNQYAKMLGKE